MPKVSGMKATTGTALARADVRLTKGLGVYEKNMTDEEKEEGTNQQQTDTSDGLWAVDLVVKKTLAEKGLLTELSNLRGYLGLQDVSKLPADVRWKYQDNEWTKALSCRAKHSTVSHLGMDVVQTLKLQIGDTLQLRPGAHSLEVVMSVREVGSELAPSETVTGVFGDCHLSSEDARDLPSCPHAVRNFQELSRCVQRPLLQRQRPVWDESWQRMNHVSQVTATKAFASLDGRPASPDEIAEPAPMRSELRCEVRAAVSAMVDEIAQADQTDATDTSDGGGPIYQGMGYCTDPASAHMGKSVVRRSDRGVESAGVVVGHMAAGETAGEPEVWLVMHRGGFREHLTELELREAIANAKATAAVPAKSCQSTDGSVTKLARLPKPVDPTAHKKTGPQPKGKRPRYSADKPPPPPPPKRRQQGKQTEHFTMKIRVPQTVRPGSICKIVSKDGKPHFVRVPLTLTAEGDDLTFVKRLPRHYQTNHLRELEEEELVCWMKHRKIKTVPTGETDGKSFGLNLLRSKEWLKQQAKSEVSSCGQACDIKHGAG